MASTPRQETQYVSVTMDDGRIVDFPGKRRMQKTSIETTDGTLQVRLDFVNGETRLFTLPDALLWKLALHGAEQKLGDEISGLDDVEDAVLAIDDLMDRLAAGDWSIRRESTGLAGASVLAKALIELTGKSPAAVKEDLKALSQGEKNALRDHPKLRPIIEKLEANKKKKASAVDTDALLSKFSAAPAQHAAHNLHAHAQAEE
jgi:hypothetical protein